MKGKKEQTHVLNRLKKSHPDKDFSELIKTLNDPEVYPTYYTLELKKKIAGAYFLITLGNISESMRRMGMHRQSFHYWYNTDEGFKIFIDSLQANEMLMDLARTALVECLSQEDSPSVKFQAAKFVHLTQGKTQGWTYRDNLIEGEEIQDRDEYAIVLPDNGRGDPIGGDTIVLKELPENG